jgi:hypothetical protein
MSALKVGPDVRNCVKMAKMNNLCTLEQIDTIVVDFCICGKSGIFVFQSQMWWYLEFTQICSIYDFYISRMHLLNSKFRNQQFDHNIW